MSEHWKWYVGQIVGIGPCAFEAEDCQGRARIRRLTVILLNNQTGRFAFGKWLPFDLRYGDEPAINQEGVIDFASVPVVFEANLKMRQELEAIWTGTKGPSNGIISASPLDLRKLGDEPRLKLT